MELDFAEEVACDPVDFVKLTITPAKWALVWILSKQLDLALCADGFLARLTFDGVLQNVLTHFTHQFWDESLYVLEVVDKFQLVEVAFLTDHITNTIWIVQRLHIIYYLNSNFNPSN